MLPFIESINLGWRDIVDISLLTFVVYRILLLIKGTRTIPMLMGFLLLLALYLLSKWFQLDAMGLVMDNFVNSIVLVFVVLFQADIRNALAQFGLMTLFRDSGQVQKDLVEHTLQACMAMARQRVGALIVFEREVGLRNYIERGTFLDCSVNEGILLSIFHPTSPLHDGAVIINRKGRLISSSCILPVSMNSKLSPVLGTRHRAAIGITEESDAIVLVVSEERSEISLGFKGDLIRESEENIKQILFELLSGTPTKKLSVNTENKKDEKTKHTDGNKPPRAKEDDDASPEDESDKFPSRSTKNDPISSVESTI